MRSDRPEGITAPFILRLFGPFEALVNGHRVSGFYSRKGAWLLALLALRKGRVAERSWLAGTLWPDSPESQALYYLRRELSCLRRALGPESYRIRSPSSGTLLLDMQGAHVDVVEFDRAAAQGGVDALERAVSLYAGALLESCDALWAGPERDSRAAFYLQALQTLADRARTAGEYEKAATFLNRIIVEDPLDETARRSLIQTLADQGNYARAIEAYRQFRLLVRQELNAEPSEETRRVFERIAAECAGRARGTDRHSLRTAAHVPPPRLPRPITRLIGRREEVREVLARLERSRIVTLTGIGGVGKTRIAIQAAEELSGALADRLWFVDLAPLTDAGRIWEAVARALRIPDEGDAPLGERIAASLGESSALVILDNCEHLKDSVRQLVEGLLLACPGLRILCTSRQSLGIPGEVDWRVPPLEVPTEEHLTSVGKDAADKLLEFAAVRLFVERAQQISQQFRVTAESLRDAASICRRLDGIPLAIELAAAQTRALTVAEIRNRLHDRFALLVSGGVASVQRQQTLLATLDWSHGLLTCAEQALLRRLAVFSGTMSLEAVEEVCAGNGLPREQILELLSSLVDQSLVEHEARPRGGRYRLLETVAEYAARRMEAAGEGDTCRRRHLNYFDRLVRSLHRGSSDLHEIEWYERIEVDHENLLQAILYAERTARWDRELGLVAEIWPFWRWRGRVREGRERVTAALSRSGNQTPSSLRAIALNGAGVLAMAQRDFDAARSLLEESIATARAVNDPGTASDALDSLAWLLSRIGDPESAGSAYQEALATARRINDRHRMRYPLNGLAELAARGGDFDAAERLYQECLEISRDLDNSHAVVWAQYGLAETARRRGNLHQAKTLLEQCCLKALAVDNRQAVAWSLTDLASIAYQERDAEKALGLFAESLSALRALESDWTVASFLPVLAHLSALTGKRERAAVLLGAAHQWKEAIVNHMPPYERAGFEEALVAAESALGEPRAIQEAAELRPMPIEEAVDYAIAPPDGE